MYRRISFVFRALLQQFSARLEIQSRQVFFGKLQISVADAVGYHENSENSVYDSRRRTDCNQTVHIGHAMPQRLETVDVKFSVYVKDWQNQQKLNERKCHAVLNAVHKSGNRQPYHVPHRYVHQKHEKNQRHNKARFHGSKAVRFRNRVRPGISVCALTRIGRFFGIGFEARLFHSVRYLFFAYYVFVEVANHAFCNKADFHRINAFEPADRALHPRRTRCAGHTRNFESLTHSEPRLFYYFILQQKNNRVNFYVKLTRLAEQNEKTKTYFL